MELMPGGNASINLKEKHRTGERVALNEMAPQQGSVSLGPMRRGYPLPERKGFKDWNLCPFVAHVDLFHFEATPLGHLKVKGKQNEILVY